MEWSTGWKFGTQVATERSTGYGDQITSSDATFAMIWTRYLCDALDTYLRDTLDNVSPLRVEPATSVMVSATYHRDGFDTLSPRWFGHYEMPPPRLFGHSRRLFGHATSACFDTLPQHSIWQPTAMMVWRRYPCLALDIDHLRSAYFTASNVTQIIQEFYVPRRFYLTL